jgi:hypothetical protein
MLFKNLVKRIKGIFQTRKHIPLFSDREIYQLVDAKFMANKYEK